MSQKEELKAQIHTAFSTAVFPGKGKLSHSDESDEATSVETEFADKPDWSEIDASFLDQAPQGFSTALSFFTNEAFRFFLPAYLIADIDEKLECVDVIFHLCHGFDEESKDQLINPERYGNQTWFDYSSKRLSEFTPAESKAVIEYLEFKTQSEYVVDFEVESIRQAIDNFWKAKAKS